jgi:signal transduction histidine kinase
VTRRWNDRLGLWNWRSALVSIALVGMAVVSAAGAWSVRASWIQHQKAVENTLDEYAIYAARTFMQAAAAENNILRERSLASVTGAPAYSGADLTLEGFAAEVSRVLDRRVAYADDPLRGVFRIDAATGAYSAFGAAADPGAEVVIRGAIAANRAAIDTAQLPVQTVLPVNGVPASIFFATQRTRSLEPVAIYGFTISWKRSFAPMIEPVLPRLTLLPPSLLGGATPDPGRASGTAPRMDTLVAFQVSLPSGEVYYQSPRQFTSPVSAVLGGQGRAIPVEVRSTLHPHLVATLRRQMLDEERRRLQLALPLLSLLFAVAAFLNVRRERELVRARRDFVASVSHELRTPLAQIRMFSETLMLGRADDEEERSRWLGIISREARRLGDLVENILLFSHIDAARMRLEPERTDLGELVEEVVEAYVPIAEAQRMRIVADAPSRIFAVVDPRAIRQVVVNLIDNALKYGPAGQTVSVEVDRTNGHAILAVSDQGPGIPVSDRRRLWRPFVRLANGASTAGGSGIGLSVVQSLVEQHGGNVAVEAAAGGGARFVVSVPTAPANGRVAAQHV